MYQAIKEFRSESLRGCRLSVQPCHPIEVRSRVMLYIHNNSVAAFQGKRKTYEGTSEPPDTRQMPNCGLQEKQLWMSRGAAKRRIKLMRHAVERYADYS